MSGSSCAILRTKFDVKGLWFRDVCFFVFGVRFDAV